MLSWLAGGLAGRWHATRNTTLLYGQSFQPTSQNHWIGNRFSPLRKISIMTCPRRHFQSLINHDVPRRYHWPSHAAQHPATRHPQSYNKKGSSARCEQRLWLREQSHPLVKLVRHWSPLVDTKQPRVSSKSHLQERSGGRARWSTRLRCSKMHRSVERVPGMIHAACCFVLRATDGVWRWRGWMGMIRAAAAT